MLRPLNSRSPFKGRSDFMPNKVDGLELWCRHNMGITSSGGVVSNWADQSGNGNDLAQATAANRPIDGSVGSNVVVNGDFPTNTDNWTALSSAILSVSSGALRITNSGANFGKAEQVLTTVAGVTYLLQVTGDGTGSSSFSTVRVGTTSAGTDLLSQQNADGTKTYTFTATSTTSYLTLGNGSGVDTEYVEFDNVTCKPITQDGSIYFDGIQRYLKAAAFTCNQPYSVYFVGKQATFTAGDIIWQGNLNTSAKLDQRLTSPNIRFFAADTGITNTNFTVNTDAVVSVVGSNGASIVQVNGGTPTTGTAGTAALAGFTLGADADGNNASNIQVKEVLVYSAAHDAPTRAQVISYLNALK